MSKTRVEPEGNGGVSKIEGQEPPGPKKRGVKIFKILNFENEEMFSKLLSAPVDIGIFIAYFGEKKCIRAQHEVYNEDADAEVTFTGPGSI